MARRHLDRRHACRSRVRVESELASDITHVEQLHRRSRGHRLPRSTGGVVRNCLVHHRADIAVR